MRSRKQIENLTVTGALSHAEALVKLATADAIVSPSRERSDADRDDSRGDESRSRDHNHERRRGRGNVRGRKNALLVRPEAPDELATAIRRLIQKRTLVRELGRKARQTYEEEFTIERFGAEFSKLIAETISAAKSK